MKRIFLLFIIASFYYSNIQAQVSDTILKKRITINGFCLCQTTLSNLKQLNTDLKEVEVEEMDLAKGCYGQDSRFIAGKGYSTKNQPGLVFQKEQQSDYISKIRLTKLFKGNLPDGNFIDVSKLTLKDLFKLYPAFKNKWGSRGCSDYWNFSNDTISFYVKIDKAIKPQFPVNEAYYMDKPIEAVDLIVSCYGIQKENTTQIIEIDDEPIFFIDSIRVNKAVLLNFEQSEISNFTIFKGPDAIKRIPEAKYGLVYLETKKHARFKYWNYLKSKSPEYAKLVPSIENDLLIQYILNGKVLKENVEASLAAINDKTFSSIQIIISKEQLVKEYGVTDKRYGVIISTINP